MMQNELEPKKVFQYFREISAVPRASYNTKGIKEYLVNFAKERSLAYWTDESDNVIIYKSASAGYEKAATVILQGHTDMVAEQAEGHHHDFEKEGIELVVDGAYLKANQTTLGADNGIAVAYALAILDDDTIEHPALEAVFTSNEEVGLLGADQLDMSQLKGKYLLNLDSEEEGFLLCGCAGGVNVNSKIPVTYRKESGCCYEITLKGLKGGHSGIEIDKPRANANKLMGRLLFELKQQIPFGLSCLWGGKAHNVIAPVASVSVVVAKEQESALEEIVRDFEKTIQREYAGVEENAAVLLEKSGEDEYPVLHPVSMEKVLFYLMNQPHGVMKMSGTISGMVETSVNAAKMGLDEESFTMLSSIRSSLETAKNHLVDRLGYLTEFLGGEYTLDGAYPAWEYQEESPLREIVQATYRKLYGQEITVTTIHAGLECGLFSGKMPGLDCVSFGPDLTGVHSPAEALSLESAKRTWELLLEILKSMKSVV